MKCASVGSCVVFMPRIDLWAVEESLQVTEESDSCSKHHHSPDQVAQKENESDKLQYASEEMIEHQCAGQSASHAWSSFIEQAESICLATTLIILVRMVPAPPPLPTPQRKRQTKLQILPELVCLLIVV